jgi:thymidine kinase
MRRPFGKILDLIGHAKRIDKLLAICKTSGKEAPFTMRTIKSNEIELIGGSDIDQAAS